MGIKWQKIFWNRNIWNIFDHVIFFFIDYKRVKGDLKKANADVAKLKKKASKKIGKQEYADQFRESMRVRNICSNNLLSCRADWANYPDWCSSLCKKYIVIILLLVNILYSVTKITGFSERIIIIRFWFIENKTLNPFCCNIRLNSR